MKDITTRQLKVKKSNRLISASFKLSLQEQRIIILLASLINEKDEAFKTYSIKIKDFAELIKVKGKSKYNEIKDIAEKLQQKVLTIETEESTLVTNWLSSQEYFKRKGYVEFCFDPKLKPHLLRLKDNYTPYSLKYVFLLKKGYAIRFYELLTQFKKIGERFFELEELKDILGLNEEGIYKLYGDVKRRIIEPAVKEINKKTDLYIQYKPRKKGRKVTGVLFNIRPNIKVVATQDRDKDINIELYIRLQKYFCLPLAQAKAFLIKYPENDIIENLKHVERRNNLGKIKDIGAYTVKAIQTNIQDQLSLFDVDKQEKNKEIAHQEAEKRLLRDLKVKYRTFRLDEHERLKKHLSGDKLEILEAQAEAEAVEKAKGKKIAIKAYKSPALQKLYDLEAKIPPEKEWIEQQLQNIKTEKQG